MLYHYTDFAAFDGIIRCAELRLNNILNMNDAAGAIRRPIARIILPAASRSAYDVGFLSGHFDMQILSFSTFSPQSSR